MKHSPLRSIAASTAFFRSYRTDSVAVALLVLLGATTSVEAQQRHIIAGHVPPAVAHLKAVGALPAANRLRLVIGLPLRNQTELERCSLN